MTEPVPAVAARYRVQGELGRGATSSVFHAESIESPHRPIALKVPLVALGHEEPVQTLFAQEAAALRALNHPSVPQLIEWTELDGAPALALTRIEGRSLGELMAALSERGQAVPLDVVVSVGALLCDVLAHVHNATDAAGAPLSMVHGDVSLHNVLLGEDGALWLVDFGFARSQEARFAYDGPGRVAHLAPEWTAPTSPVDARADLFSVGVLLWELLCGERLFVRSHEPLTSEAVRSAQIATVRERVPACPPALCELVAQALERNPAQRWPSAAAMHLRLHECLRELEVTEPRQAIGLWLAELGPLPHALGDSSWRQELSLSSLTLQRTSTALEGPTSQPRGVRSVRDLSLRELAELAEHPELNLAGTASLEVPSVRLTFPEAEGSEQELEDPEAQTPKDRYTGPLALIASIVLLAYILSAVAR